MFCWFIKNAQWISSPANAIYRIEFFSKHLQLCIVNCVVEKKTFKKLENCSECKMSRWDGENELYAISTWKSMIFTFLIFHITRHIDVWVSIELLCLNKRWVHELSEHSNASNLKKFELFEVREKVRSNISNSSSPVCSNFENLLECSSRLISEYFFFFVMYQQR